MAADLTLILRQRTHRPQSAELVVIPHVSLHHPLWYDIDDQDI